MSVNPTNVLNLLETKVNKKFKIDPIPDPEDHEFVDILLTLITQKRHSRISIGCMPFQQTF